jgi:hypothetical protein
MGEVTVITGKPTLTRCAEPGLDKKLCSEETVQCLIVLSGG